jgi:hypothetical protein
MFRFKEEYQRLCADTRSVKGASKLSCYSDFLWFDIDSKDLVKALANTRQLVMNIEQHDSSLPDYLAIYFSGCKGFHVGIPAALFGWQPSVELPRIHKLMALEIAAGVAIDTAIYESNRLWRIPNTQHGESGLYKVPLTYNQLQSWSIEQIKKFAVGLTAEPALAIPESTESEPNERLRIMYEQARDKLQHSKTSKPRGETSSMQNDELKKPCIQKLLAGVDEGQRNEAAVRLSTSFKKNGYSQEKTFESISEWNLRNQPPLSETELETICQSAWEGPYDYGCNDDVLRKLCDPSCYLRKNETSDSRRSRNVTVL